MTQYINNEYVEMDFRGVNIKEEELRNTFFPKTIKMNFGAIKNTKFPFRGYFKILA
ncbi:hypothetical protein [Bacillus sp. H1a]|uniref:hypothetical protein n=1 Tax=Bacillus sp. H1a TaxID=1397276 RepID=UPI000AD0B57C|nr:hypothetical protein [Bacillus sp. H1a]